MGNRLGDNRLNINSNKDVKKGLTLSEIIVFYAVMSRGGSLESYDITTLRNTNFVKLYKDNPIQYALRAHRNKKVIDRLIAIKPEWIDEFNKYKYNSIHYCAAEYNDTEILDRLVYSSIAGQQIINIKTADGKTPLWFAIKNNRNHILEDNVDYIDHIIQLGGNITDVLELERDSQEQTSLLHKVAIHNYSMKIEQLIRIGFNIDRTDKSGKTALETIFEMFTSDTLHLSDTYRDSIALNIKTLILLRYGVIEEYRGYYFPDGITDDEVLEIRYRVYFRESLAYRLLFYGHQTTK